MKSKTYSKKLFLAVVTASFATSFFTYADTLATWLVPTSTAAVSQTISGSTAFSEMITLNAINFTGTFALSSSGWGGSGFTTQATPGAGVSKNFNFSITAKPGNQIVVTEVANIQMTQTSGGTGPDVYTVYYSLDNWATSTQMASVSGCKAVAKDLTTSINEFLKLNSGANAITVKSNKTLAFRIVGTLAGSTGGTARLLKDAVFTLIGTVSATPVPSLVWGGGEIGVWDYTTTNWLDGSTPTAFSSGALATISSPSSITVEASGVTAAVLTNSISSGATTISGGVLDVPTLVKEGAGTLNISNTFTNITTVQLNAGRLALWGGRTNNLGGGSSITGMPNLTMVDGTTLDLGDTDQYVANFNGAGTVVMTNVNSSGAPVNDFKVACTIPSSFSGSITGVGTFRLSGGVFTNLGNNTYTGGTWISNGATMYIADESALPVQTKDNPLTTTNGPGTAVDLRISSGGGLLGLYHPFPSRSIVRLEIRRRMVRSEFSRRLILLPTLS